MATIRLFAQAREAAGTATDRIDAPDVAAVLVEARRRYGPPFEEVLTTCKIWLNGEPVDDPTKERVGPEDEVAVLPPVSGG